MAALAVSASIFIPAWSVAGAKRQKPALTRQAIWQALQKRIRRDYGSFRGSAGIVVKDLSTGWETDLNKDCRFAAASLIKIPIMGGMLQGRAGGTHLARRHPGA